ncbi:MAG TPA: polyprenyl diphosphate synthase, partial [Acidimicrobiia bacterium]
MTAAPDPKGIPRHVAIVMDGNGRWATRRGLKRTEGHAAGEEALFDTVHGGLEIGLEWMTVFAFSTENWRRPLDEVRFIMNFNENLLLNRRAELHDLGVRVRFIGRRGGRVPGRVRRRIEETEAMTARNRRMTLTFAFNYGARAELVDAARSIAREARGRRLHPDKINERTLSRHLYAPDMPDPDLLVRTSGEYRISNFLLW